MDFGNMLGDSFSYAKDAVWGKWGRWILLVISTIIFPLIMGYMVRIYSGVKPAPEAENWVGMFIDGLKLWIIGLIYAIPVFIIMTIFIIPAAMVADGDPMLAIGSIGIGLIVTLIVAIIISLIAAIGMIRFAQKDSMGQAFAFGAILEHIGKIGWGSYIIALIVLWIVGIVFGFIVGILVVIPVLGWLITLFLYPVWIIFTARYMTLIYESAPAPA
ncbi:DUF4013 domain-containing protein [Methanoculleus sp.]|uniref:DUF4013 domain-containing protein n=1 Tax=Methanoculleus sp. TaxID=90427 RepID=UPI0025D564E6|nr:DUF4013 domain-containing protein [Methanoculleus sp.]MCK9317774.1 DUF4013 domain-containing protein [Methanoculleus sp.]MDD2788012.1 DUF4013 domain-containing protein [Methanoculleus sp.]MDD4314663.1 DUF4013 domain-containing protein [Methanoculleus sp.]MDD4470562.1 DUF4013 domain-containing protein [Methanoculleus sp.]HOI57475.1 DUF4013 domain-containing protein [Methanoculleus sp.]